jgi:hypothetical protein
MNECKEYYMTANKVLAKPKIRPVAFPTLMVGDLDQAYSPVRRTDQCCAEIDMKKLLPDQQSNS